MRPRTWLPFFAANLVLLTPAWVSAQVSAGGEFRANTYTNDAQRAPAVAQEPDGDFVVVWHSYGQGGLGGGSGYGIFGQRYDASGAPRGAEFQVNTFTTGYQYLPWVAADGRGRFVVVWNTFYASPDGSLGSVHGRRFAADGSPLGAEFIVNTYTTGEQYWGRVASAPNGDFVMVWESEVGQSATEIRAQRFDRTGQRLGGEFQVNTVTTGFQVFPAVDLQPNGSFVVAWAGSDGGQYGIFAQRFGASGASQGGEFRVNSYTTDFQEFPSVAVAANGNFVVVWQSYTQDGSGYGVFAQRFDTGGVPQGAEFRVNTYTTNYQSGRPVVASDEVGNFVVSWRTLAPQDGSGYAAIGRRFMANGTPRSPEFIVNTYTTGFQDMAHVATDQVGNFAFAWRSFGQDGSFSGVFGQRFGGLHRFNVRVDTVAGPTQDGNLVLEPGETVNVRPTWRNVNGAAQTFGGVMAGAGGPAGCTQAIVDGVGDYGTVANGAIQLYTDCYSVLAGATRCQLHWDVSVIETLTPDVQGQAKDWALHVGESFTDVPKASPFYRFIETILHNNITGGCTATTYCPANATARDQMAVFALVAKEGPGYQPPACTTPLFNDVPASSPFCRFVEELNRRGVVSGCGGGNYCPAAPATREQMAVFVLRTLEPTFDPPACTTPVFNDVPASSPFCKYIEELNRRGVVSGCGGGNYCPTDPVTREQMSVFIAVTFGLTLYGP